jgi:hypothetical protein
MSIANLDGLLWLLLLIAPLLFLQRNLHREIQAIFLLLTRQPEIAVALFSLIFLPGVLLHETSHYLMARLLGVRTGRFSIVPQKMEDGRLQLGFVETAAVDFFRDALIGAAPLITGGLFVAFAGLARMGLNTLWASLAGGQMRVFLDTLTSLTEQPDFWLWFYLTFTISSTMLPSASDRRAWLPLLLVILVLLGLTLLAGAGPWLVAHLAPTLNSALRSVAVVFGITVLLHLILFPPAWALRKLISRLVGYQVV